MTGRVSAPVFRHDGTPARLQGRAVLAACAFGAAVLGWPIHSVAQVIKITTPTISIGRVTVSPPTITVPNTDSITSSIDTATANVQAQVDATRTLPATEAVAGAVNLPPVPTPQIAAVTTGIVDSTVEAVTATTGQVTATIGGQGLGALVGPGLAAAGQVQVRTDVVNLTSGVISTVDFYGDGLINFAVGGPTASVAGTNGVITIAPAAAGGIVDNAINTSGLAQSQAIRVLDDQVALVGGLEPIAVDAPSAPARSGRTADPVAAILADNAFRPGGYGLVGAIRFGPGAGDERPAPRMWSGGNRGLFGRADGAGGTTQPAPDSDPDQGPARNSPIRSILSGLITAPEAGEERSAAVTIVTKVEALVGEQQLTPADVCQAAGGGGVGLPGCGATEAFGAVVTLEPDATGDGCALISGSGGLRLACGNGTDPFSGTPGDLTRDGTSPIEPNQTLQDLLELWLQQPAQPSLPVIATRDGDRTQIAAGTVPGSFGDLLN